MPEHWDYDPTLYEGAAVHYAARPPYSADLHDALAPERRDGRMLDVGCGPGPLARLFSDRFHEVIAVDPDAGMLAEAAHLASAEGINNVRWIRGLAEDLLSLVAPPFQLVTFGQSFHWTERARVAEIVFTLLEPGGALALVSHNHQHRPVPANTTGAPPIPHDQIHALIRGYLGEQRRAGNTTIPLADDPHVPVLCRSSFGAAETAFLPGREDLVVTIDSLLSNFLSMSFATPRMFGDRLGAFTQDFRTLLAPLSPSGLFWDWPGDTEVILARKPGLLST
jgi:SAM-dependent methyltransferase